MTNERALRDLGLTKYEASAYATLLKEGITGAQELSRQADIPVGKIYEVLSGLNNMGLVEFQRSRPRKYRAVKPSIALKNLYAKKEEETKNELENFKLRVAELETRFSEIAQPEHAELKFWSTLIGQDDIIKNFKNILEEAENEIINVKPAKMAELFHSNKCFDPKTIVPIIINEFFRAAEKGIRIKTLVPEEIYDTYMKEKFESMQDKVRNNVAEYNIDIRILDCDYDFILVDSYIIYIPIPDALNPQKTFGQLKVYDREYAQKLRDKFEELWIKGRKVKTTV